MNREQTYRLVAVSLDRTRVVLGTRLTEAQAEAIIDLLSQGEVATQIVVEPELP